MRKFIISISSFLLLSVFGHPLLAQENIYKSVISDQQGTPFLLGSTISFDDPVYASPSLRPLIGPVKKMQNVVKLVIYEESEDIIPGDFTADITVAITKTPWQGGSPVTVNRLLHLDYRRGMGLKSDAASYFVDDDGGYILTVEIIGPNPFSSGLNSIKKFLRIEAEIRSVYDAPFDYASPITGLAHVLPTTNPFDELKLQWSYPSGANGTFNSFPTDYDLEWAWIEESAVNDYKTGANWDPVKIFADNATRVTLPINFSVCEKLENGQQECYNYKIPLFYDGEGWVFYRVRSVQKKTDGQVINGNWTTSITEGNGIYHYLDGHEKNLNWQVSTTYAEDGKRKTVIQYFDGTLRGRQTVTKDNSQLDDNEKPTTVVAETFYDYQGRPTIQVLPAPTLNNVISFTKNFNKNVNTPNDGYPKDIYDMLQTGQAVCNNAAPALSKNAELNGANGAGNYYSSLNPDVNDGFNKFIPDANGFAFTETRYVQDATGRIAAQSGVGEAYRLGTGHETQYYYSSPTQTEIDLLFGTDAGKASHYQKNMVKDANGQFSVSYVDMHGRTVATALAGNNPTSLQALQSLTDLEQALLTMTPVKKELLTEETNVVNGRSVIMVKELLVPNPGRYTFRYKLDPEQLKVKNCQNVDLCYDCLYDLTITITSNCSDDGFQPVSETKKNFTLPYTSVCNTNPAPIEVLIEDLFIATAGSYTITKTLTLSKDAQDQFRDQAMQYGNLVCKSYEEIKEVIRTVMLLQNANCQPTCASCTTALGTYAVFKENFRIRAELDPDQMPDYETELKKAYKQAKEDCDAICENGSDRVNNYRDIMLLDVTPDRGQYARIWKDVDDNGNPITPPIDISKRDYNIFYPITYPQDLNGKIPYKRPVDEHDSPDPLGYRDEYGNPAPDGEVDDLKSYSPDQFNQHFKESWAEQLLFYHPEYKKLKLVESDPMKAAFKWQELWQNKTKWSEVSSIVPNILAADPFWSTVLSGSSLQTQMADKMNAAIAIRTGTNVYYNAGMWQFAIASVKCKDALTGNQVTCLQGCTNTIGSFPAEISCEADRDMVWRIFSSLYFKEREIFVYKYLQAAAPVSESLFAPPSNPNYIQYQARFINPESANFQGYLPSDLANVYTQATSTNSPGSNSQATAALQAEYEENCRSYAVRWLEKIDAFKVCKTSITQTDLDNLIEQLVSVCKRGSDLDHPLGSSSAAPDQQISGSNSFEEVLTTFMTANGIPLNENCNPYIIDWPKPYDRSPSLGNEEIVEAKPEQCICDRIQSLNNQYVAAPNGATDLSDYIKTRYGVTIDQLLLTQLLQLCDPQLPPSACTYLAEPIKLPPFLQCGASDETCIDCQQYNTYRTQFFTKFSSSIPSGVTIPVKQPEDDLEMAWNKAFANFMNYRTGFAKQWHEYAAFEKNCEFINSPAGIQSRFENLISTFYFTYPERTGDDDCSTLFTGYFNEQEGTNYSFEEIQRVYSICFPTSACLSISCCSNCRPAETFQTLATTCGTALPTHLCGLIDPVSPTLEIEPDDPCKDIDQLVLHASTEAWILYQQTIKDDFDKKYQEKCLVVKDIESFTVEAADEKEYHYTLYYYDQAGNLVQTVPPAGVDNFNNNTTLRNQFLANVKTARQNDAAHRPAHTLPTVYRYNTLNQVVQQKSPDGGLSKFWYDELGRLVVSQNAKQAVNNRYSYTIYDDLGRITQVGEKPTTAAISPATTRNKQDLYNWLHTTGSRKQQITRTVYDVSYYNGEANPPISPLLVQRNLRNRVSYTQVVLIEPTNFLSNPNAWIQVHSTATYYSYDIHGNVDELLQDYNQAPMTDGPNEDNRFKKMAYTYDLISGKVNTVTYQPDYIDVNGVLRHNIDRFYHRYDYDAENKLTATQTSHDGIIWETDARYFYYKHGPLARTIVGQQQVQGIDYAYTLQGWLKGVNSTAISAAPIENCAPGTARDVLDVYDRNQYGHPSVYTARQEINFHPDFFSDNPDDFTTLIDPNLPVCVPVIAPTPFTTGDMGEDGKAGGAHPAVARDAYSFSLNYYTTNIGGQVVNDYTSINAQAQPFTGGMFNLINVDANTVAKPLFNGNIASMFVNIPKLGEAHLYGYQYDQLNRIVSMDAFKGFVPTQNGWQTNGPVASQNYKERITYDPNGNILTYFRNGSITPPAGGGPAGQQAMDQMTYQYAKEPGTGKLLNNRLRYVHDQVDKDNYGEDIDSQTPLSLLLVQDEKLPEQSGDNYRYDEIGNLVKDKSEGILEISWTVYGKINSITKDADKDETTTNDRTIIDYTYDASGNRITKTIIPPGDPQTLIIKTTIYVRDASGNVMAVYEKGNSEINNGNLSQTEVHLYGSSRLGIYNIERNVENPATNTDGIYSFERGTKIFELSNHLGNVLVTLSDKKIAVDSDGDGDIDYYEADLTSAQDYYPFGMTMTGRKFEHIGKNYRFSINGQEKEPELNENITSAEFWVYDSRIARRWNTDPVFKPWESPYAVFSNNPILMIDPYGDSDTLSAAHLSGKQMLIEKNAQRMKELEPQIHKYKTALGEMKTLINNKAIWDIGMVWNVFYWAGDEGRNSGDNTNTLDWMAEQYAKRVGELESLVKEYNESYSAYTNLSASLKKNYEKANALKFEDGLILERLRVNKAGILVGASQLHLNSSKAKAAYSLYEIAIDGTIYKFGIAHAGRIVQTGEHAGLPVRLAQQLSKIKSLLPNASVTHLIHTTLTVTKAEMIVVETRRVLEYARATGFIPDGNPAHWKKFTEFAVKGFYPKALKAVSQWLKLIK